MKVIIVAGPTATGKTETAVEIAKKCNGELINADSRQVYKYLNIGTNKGELKIINDKYYINDIPIHLVNILNPDERFNLFDFQKKALDIILEITTRGKVPILVGGTGLYIDSLVKGYILNESNTKDRDILEKLSLDELQKQISQENLNKLNNSDRNNPRRLIRLIEKSEVSSPIINIKLLQTFILYPNYSWEELKRRIDNRVDEMFKKGIIDETQELINKGLSIDSEGFKIMGYKQVISYLNKETDLKSCIERVKIVHKQYAKRQRTWFEGSGRGYSLNKYSNSDEAISLSENFFNNGV